MSGVSGRSFITGTTYCYITIGTQNYCNTSFQVTVPGGCSPTIGILNVTSGANGAWNFLLANCTGISTSGTTCTVSVQYGNYSGSWSGSVNVWVNYILI